MYFVVLSLNDGTPTPITTYCEEDNYDEKVALLTAMKKLMPQEVVTH